MHFGNTDGTGAGGRPDGEDDVCEAGVVEAACVFGGATHLVQIVEVTVLRITDTVCVTRMLLLLPVVIVSVTGHVVKVVRMLRRSCQLQQALINDCSGLHLSGDNVLSSGRHRWCGSGSRTLRT